MIAQQNPNTQIQKEGILNTQSQISMEQQYQQPNTALPEDNGSNGETSRFGTLWDRTVNGDRNGGNHNNENRW